MSLDHKIIWHEVHCKDLDATVAFYHELFGWTVKDEERETYVHLYHDGQTVAGLMADVAEQGAPPCWTVYVGTSDIEAYAERARAAGQTELTPLMDIPHTGKLQILADPQGGVLAPFQPTHAERDHWDSSGKTGHFCWVELLCRDQAAAVAHYKQVVGWDTMDMDMGSETYTMFVPPGGGQMDAIGGAMQMPPDQPGPAAWLPYVSVDDVDASAAKAVDLGGKLFVPPTPIPDYGRFAVIGDPEGATFAVFKRTGEC